MNLKSFVPAITWIVISTILLSLPGDDLPHSSFFNIPFFDKWVHFGMFFLLTALFCLPLFKSAFAFRTVTSWFVKIAALVIIYGILMEFVQKYWTYGRSFDIADIAVDSLGSLFGYFSSKKYYLKKNRPRWKSGPQPKLTAYEKI